jgi:hypothetical protein
MDKSDSHFRCLSAEWEYSIADGTSTATELNYSATKPDG